MKEKLSCLKQNSGQVLFTLVVVLCLSSGPESASNNTDKLALLDFKNMITQDPFQIMHYWNDSVHFCYWFGVSCSDGRVLTLNLESQRLTGSIPPSIGNLTSITGINLRNNSFHGEIPEEVGRLSRLQFLNLTHNYFTGKIPTNLTQEIEVLDVGYNELTGEIPEQLSLNTKLVVLILGSNNFTGTIPPWIGNFSSLYILSLALNNFQGTIPTELGRIPGLGKFQVYGNFLSGTIPPSIYNISTMYYFSVTQNRLHGKLPPDVGLKFPKLQIFAGGVNSFTGQIPVSLSNASQLQVLDFAQNGLVGTIPKNLQSLQRLYRINFDENNLGNGEIGDLDFLSYLANCTSLEVLGLGYNRFGGELPASIGNLSTQLQILTLGGNLLHGSIPTEIQNLLNLYLLGFERNNLSGNVPDVIGKLQSLQGLELNYNRFSGLIPFSLGNLTRLTRLFMDENRFEGSIPPSLGNCQNLQNLNLSVNRLNGSIPKEVIGLSSLSIAVVITHNFLTGPLPLEVGNLVNLAELDLSENKLSGEIPSTLGSCVDLERLHFEGNQFEGTIPETLHSLRGLADFDLSRNSLSGKIPEFLSRFSSLKHLNLSYNDFEGEVPKDGIFANVSAVSLTGNNKLCGGIPELQLPTCFGKRQREPLSTKAVIAVSVAIAFVIALVGSFAIFWILRSSRIKETTVPPPDQDWQVSMSYSEVAKLTNNFADENIIGSGSFGSVYKGISGDEKIVAIKVLNLQLQGASKSFMDECNALRSVRHRNLLRIITACSTIDRRGHDFKALVFEFMANGNLDQWLHPDEQYQTKQLSLIQRLNIAIDIASALDYLHHHCETPIVHCDLKPSNVLLDEYMTAHVGDFGMAKFLFESIKIPSNIQAMSAALKGSIGYIPPEYGQSGQVSVLGDAYSYGILLLEMFTGKRPTDEMFKDDINIHKFVEMAWPEHVMDIIDSSMLVEEESEDDSSKSQEYMEEKAAIKEVDPKVSMLSNVEECLASVMRIGLVCSEKSPTKRMGMDFAVNKLQGVRDSYLKSMNMKKKI